MWLADTHVLVYRYDGRFPDKQAVATELLRGGVATGELRLAHQVLVEFIAAVTRPQRDGSGPLLQQAEAFRELDEWAAITKVLYPTPAVLRLAIAGAAAYGMSWFDAHLWACAEHFGVGRLVSEDFQHGRLYGTVQVENPFADRSPAG